MNPQWPYPTPTDATSWNSFTRRDNLLRQCEEHKGQIDPATMRDIIATDMKEGGAANDFTVYQLTVEPLSQKLWLRVVGSCPWTEIDLKGFFEE